MTTKKSIFDEQPSILASVEGHHLVQAVNPKFLDWLLRVKAEVDRLNEYIDARQLIVNQFAFTDGRYWWKGEDLNEMKAKAHQLDTLIELYPFAGDITYQEISEMMEKAEKWDALPMKLLDLMIPTGPGRDPKQIGIHNAVVGAVITLMETGEEELKILEDS